MDRYSGWRNTKMGRDILKNDAQWGADDSAVGCVVVGSLVS